VTPINPVISWSSQGSIEEGAVSSAAWVGGGSDAVLITNPQDATAPINIYRFSGDNPSLVQLHDSYMLPDCTQVSIIYESSAAHWMVSCRDTLAENYYIRHAYTP
jgi:hypothetical protein